MAALKSAGWGSARDLAGMRYEHLRVLLDDDATWSSFVSMSQAFARAEVPEDIAAGVALGRLTALRKDSPGVRGIVAGSVMRRLVGRSLASGFGDAITEATSPFQYALQTRAGTDAVGQALRLLTDLFPELVIVSVDGVGAFDHVRRSAMLQKLMSCPSLSALVPYVRQWYGRQSCYLWTDEDGVVHDILQGEGGEQGDPLMPALFALAQHDALEAARRRLHDDDFLFAFLDDLYIVTTRDRAREAFDIVTGEVERRAGVRTNQGKLRLWSKAGGPRPPGFAEFGGEVWTSDAAPAKQGLKILGTPIGRKEFIEDLTGKRLADETRFLEKVLTLGDVQSAWLMLTFCGVPRANHWLCVLPPNLVADYAQKHDEFIWVTFCNLVGCASLPGDVVARNEASLPARSGGLGL